MMMEGEKVAKEDAEPGPVKNRAEDVWEEGKVEGKEGEGEGGTKEGGVG